MNVSLARLIGDEKNVRYSHISVWCEDHTWSYNSSTFYGVKPKVEIVKVYDTSEIVCPKKIWFA